MNCQAIEQAAGWISAADALVVAAGAGMGVDSGLPDFRGPEGFWQAYPAYRKSGLRFEAMANPAHFADDPGLGWGFYGHRQNLYRATMPHAGFAVLRRWIDRCSAGGFVFTSNVDDHFGRAGFDRERIVEIHGSIEWRQCMARCGQPIWASGDQAVEVDAETLRATRPLPACPRCGALARPNILMFGDGDWLPDRTDDQLSRLNRWLEGVAGSRVVVIEVGAGTTVPTVRRCSEQLVTAIGARFVRINAREPAVPEHQIGLDGTGLATIQAIDQRL